VFNKQHHKRHLSQCITFCSSEAPAKASPFASPPSPNYRIYSLSHWRAKGLLQVRRKGNVYRGKTLSCKQTVTAAVKVIFTHGRKTWGTEVAKQCRRQQDPFSSQDRELLKAVQNLFCLIPA